jgi:hypothetical protein
MIDTVRDMDRGLLVSGSTAGIDREWARAINHVLMP